MSPERQSRSIDPNRQVRKYVERGARRWEHQKIAAELYKWSDVFRFYFLRPQAEYQPEIPNLVIGVESMRIDVLASYHLKENSVGLPYEITFNEHYIKRPIWELNESLLHEMVHLFQQETPGMQPCKHNYHNAQFVAICEELGLHPRLGSGAHWRPADGQFERLMTRFGVNKPAYAEAGNVEVPPESPKKHWWDDDRGKAKGKSNLILYLNPDCKKKQPCKLRSGRSDLNIVCQDCGGKFDPQL